MNISCDAVHITLQSRLNPVLFFFTYTAFIRVIVALFCQILHCESFGATIMQGNLLHNILHFNAKTLLVLKKNKKKTLRNKFSCLCNVSRLYAVC